MEEITLKIGRINRRIEKALGHEFGSDVSVYLTNVTLDEMAAKWPTTYLSRVEEMGKIVASPDYVSYSPTGKRLYLIKEYLRAGRFCQVVMEIEEEKKLFLRNLTNLTEATCQRINQESPIQRVN